MNPDEKRKRITAIFEYLAETGGDCSVMDITKRLNNRFGSPLHYSEIAMYRTQWIQRRDLNRAVIPSKVPPVPLLPEFKDVATTVLVTSPPPATTPAVPEVKPQPQEEESTAMTTTPKKHPSRNTEAANIARLDPDGIIKRKEMAREMIEAGKTAAWSARGARSGGRRPGASATTGQEPSMATPASRSTGWSGPSSPGRQCGSEDGPRSDEEAGGDRRPGQPVQGSEKMRDIVKVMKAIRPLLLEGGIDPTRFDALALHVGFTAPEQMRMRWEQLCELMVEQLPRPVVGAPAWALKVSDIIEGRVNVDEERDAELAALKAECKTHREEATAWKNTAGVLEAQRDNLATQVGVLREALEVVQALVDDVDQGPRIEKSREWRIQWTPKAVGAFVAVAKALSSTATLARERDDRLRAEAKAYHRESERLVWQDALAKLADVHTDEETPEQAIAATLAKVRAEVEAEINADWRAIQEGQPPDAIAKHDTKVRAEERERCAKAVEDVEPVGYADKDRPSQIWLYNGPGTVLACAAAIRALGETP